MFVTDAALALSSAVRDSNMTVRIRACWALGNLCDALVIGADSGSGEVSEALRKTETLGTSVEEHGADSFGVSLSEENVEVVEEEEKDGGESVESEFPRDVLLMIVESALVAASDTDRIRCNAVRALGNFTRFVPGRLLMEEEQLFKRVVSVLIENLRSHSNNPRRALSAKVRWNAAYALGNLFSNSRLPVHSSACLDHALVSLADSLQTSNFKIRINAARAIAVPGSMSTYRSSYLRLLRAISSSLCGVVREVDVATSSSTSPGELQDYPEQLCEQLVRTIHHLIRVPDAPLSLLKVNDWEALQDSLMRTRARGIDPDNLSSLSLEVILPFCPTPSTSTSASLPLSSV
eukprot:TRINITY_DN12200_c0_g1_i1.p1 TRINITY_DN12200_c0_g1~~TRINITY_DN12200_c0_g1_i1.p1  ORF type:complete len:401 (+),score=58.34 TRINITY_DN12200_c0_g1_i1:159-1205(+)